MPYVGRDPRRGNYLKLDDIQSSFNGSDKTFNLTSGGTAYYPDSTLSVLVSVGGTVLEPATDYGITNNQITFTNAPLAAYNFFAIVQSTAVNIGVPGDGVVTAAKLAKPLWYDEYFKLDSGNNRVGIGVENPDSLLHLKSATSPTIHLEDSSQTTKLKLYAQDSSSVVGTYTNHPLIFTTNSAAERLKISADGSQCTITSNAHDGGLEVLAGNSSQETRIRLQGKAANGTAHEWYMGASRSADRFYVSNGTTSHFTILDDGKIGINSTTPASSFEIHGGEDNPGISLKRNTGGGDVASISWHAQNASPSAVAKINYRGGAAPGGLQFYSGGGTSSELRMLINPAGLVGINTTSPVDLLSIGAAANTLAFGCKDKTRGNHVWQLLNNDNSGNAEFRMYKNSVTGTHAQSINFATSGDANYILDGNFGIGTNLPDTLLHAKGSGSTGITFEGSSSNTNPISGDAGTYLILKNKSATDGNFSNILGTDAGGQATSQISFVSKEQSTNAGELVFGTRVASGSMAERLRIDSSGRLITGGNVTPYPTRAATFQPVSGQSNTYVSIIAGSTSAVSGITFGDAAGSAAGNYAGMLEYYHADDRLTYAQNASPKVTIDSLGNVGIGKTNPATILDIKSAKASDGLTITKGSNVAAFLGHNGTGDEGLLHLKDGGTTTIQIYGESGQVSFFNAGNVGINESSPQSALHIGSGGALRFERGDGTRYGKLFNDNSFVELSASTDPIRLNAQSYIRFDIADGEKARIDSDGRLRIGNTTQNQYTAADDLIIGTGSGDRGLTLYSGSADAGVIAFSDGTVDTAYRSGQIIYSHASDAMDFRTNGNYIRLTIDSSGHMGLGVTPNANWPTNGDSKALQIGTGLAVFGRGSGDEDRGGIAVNYYTDGSSNKYIGNGNANRIYMNDGNIDFQYSSDGDQQNAATNSSGAGAALTFAKALRIGSDGQVQVSAPNSGTHFSVGTGSHLATMTICDTTQPSAIGYGGKIIFASKYYNSTNTMAGAYIGQYKMAAPSNGVDEYRHSLSFGTRNETDGMQERMRITHKGHLLLGGTADVTDLTGDPNGQRGLVIGNTGMGNAGIAIINSTTGAGRIYFGDATGSNAARNRGQIAYYHNDSVDSDYMAFSTSAEERLRLTNDGRLFLGDSINTIADGYKMAIKETSSENAMITFLDTDNMRGGFCGIVKGANEVYTGTTNVDFLVGSTYENTTIISGDGSSSTGVRRVTVQKTGEIQSAAGGFVSYIKSDVNVSHDTHGWSQNGWETVISSNALGDSASTYLVNFHWSHEGFGSPYIVRGNFLWTPTGANHNGAVGASFVPVQCAHSFHGPSRTFQFQGVAAGNVRAGIQARALNWDPSNSNSYGILYVRATRIADDWT